MTQRSFFDAPTVDMSKGPTSLEQAQQRGRRGAEAAGAHANHERRGWMKRACAFVATFAAEQTQPWLLEDARRYAEANGVPEPPDRRAWGAVPQVLKRQGIIVPAGYAAAISSNGSPKCLWTRGLR